MGGSRLPDTNSAANIVYLDPACHALVESQRSAAYLRGLLLRDGQDPASEPFGSVTGWWYLDDQGGKHRA